MADFTTLAIDLGSTFGFAVGKNGLIVDSGEVTLSKDPGKTHPGYRWLKFQQWLTKYSDVNEILFEDVQFVTSPQQMKVYGALLAILQVFALAHGIRMRSLTPGQIKKDFTGNGASKKDVLCEVAMDLGWRNGTRGTMNNHNEADAIALLWVVYVRGNIEPSFANG